MITPEALIKEDKQDSKHKNASDTKEFTKDFIDSRALLGGRPAVSISHNGELYQLRATRQGKLILTK